MPACVRAGACTCRSTRVRARAHGDRRGGAIYAGTRACRRRARGSGRGPVWEGACVRARVRSAMGRGFGLAGGPFGRARRQGDVKQRCSAVGNAAFSVTAGVVARVDVRPATPACLWTTRSAQLAVEAVPGKAAAACLGLGSEPGPRGQAPAARWQGPCRGWLRGGPRFSQMAAGGRDASGTRSERSGGRCREDGPSSLRRGGGGTAGPPLLWRQGEMARATPAGRHSGRESSPSPRRLG